MNGFDSFEHQFKQLKSEIYKLDASVLVCESKRKCAAHSRTEIQRKRKFCHTFRRDFFLSTDSVSRKICFTENYKFNYFRWISLKRTTSADKRGARAREIIRLHTIFEFSTDQSASTACQIERQNDRVFRYCRPPCKISLSFGPSASRHSQFERIRISVRTSPYDSRILKYKIAFKTEHSRADRLMYFFVFSVLRLATRRPFTLFISIRNCLSMKSTTPHFTISGPELHLYHFSRAPSHAKQRRPTQRQKLDSIRLHVVTFSI